VVERFGEADEPALKEQVARALVNAGPVLGQLGRFDEALEHYARVVQRFGEAGDPVLKEGVARALVNGGAVLGQLGRFDDELERYAEVVERFGEADEPALKEQVASALVNGSVVLGQLGRFEESLVRCADAVKRFSNEISTDLQRLVAESVILSSKQTDDHGVITNLFTDWYRQLPFSDTSIIQIFNDAVIQLYAADMTDNRLVDILGSDKRRSKSFQPLIVALRQEAGEQVRAPVEVLDVAKDIREKIEQMRNKVDS